MVVCLETRRSVRFGVDGRPSSATHDMWRGRDVQDHGAIPPTDPEGTGGQHDRGIGVAGVY